MSAEKWELLMAFPNRVEADRVAAFLQSSEIPSYVDHGALGIGIEGESKVFVAAELADRARWLTSLPEIADAELDSLSTGRPRRSDG
jgi:hypothetical protein